MGSLGGSSVPDKISSLPLIDFSRFTSSPEERLAVSKELVKAFKEVGFVYLINHGIPQEMVKEAFDWVSIYVLKDTGRRPPLSLSTLCVESVTFALG